MIAVWFLGSLVVVGLVAYAIGQRVTTARYSTFMEIRELESRGRGVTLNRVIISR